MNNWTLWLLWLLLGAWTRCMPIGSLPCPAAVFMPLLHWLFPLVVAAHVLLALVQLNPSQGRHQVLTGLCFASAAAELGCHRRLQAQVVVPLLPGCTQRLLLSLQPHRNAPLPLHDTLQFFVQVLAPAHNSMNGLSPRQWRTMLPPWHQLQA
jgi:hypothetical protein